MPAVFVQKKVLEFCSKTFFYGILYCRTMHNNVQQCRTMHNNVQQCRTMHNNNAQRRAKKWNRKAELQ